MANIWDNFWSCPLWIRKNRQLLNCKFIYRVISISQQQLVHSISVT